MTPEHYDQFRQFSGHMRIFGNSRLFLIAGGPNGNDIRWPRKSSDQTVGVRNENWGCGGSMTPEHYADQFRQFSAYMRIFKNSRLFLIACGPNGNDIRWPRKSLDQTVGVRLRSGFAMHFYEGGDKPPAEFTADAM